MDNTNYFQVITVTNGVESAWAEYTTYDRAVEEVDRLAGLGFFAYVEAPESTVVVTTD